MEQKIEMYLAANHECFPEDKILFLRERLRELDENKFAMVSYMELKKPMTMFVISFFLGAYGVDRFMLGETGMGVLKLLTCGACGVLSIIDWCTIMKKTKEWNFNKLMSLISL